MAGLLHQSLLMWASRRMMMDGFVVAGFDGVAERGGHFNSLPIPFVVGDRRPDAWGAVEDGSLIAFAEAKSAGDIMTARSVDQFRTFGAVRMQGGRPCPLYVAVPRETARKLDAALQAAGLASARHVIRLHIPEIMLKERCHAA